ncbi:hypothetical protein ASG31_03590 [Chryseobacterium sp. Leaf404]|uniref:hypothetical protein n=1 Tax=unclassified Chryseobacterium TaxID=2593645 RepID=UPI0006FC1386|nr:MULTISPECIES: hypothetical protein [unclassified Chryseobacterium]KQT22418.1 hypothetical protein ASG31_03590 [Chryseobacterium sp. Leaf404]
MEYMPESFLGKSFEELQDVLVLKDYDYSFVKNNISDPYFCFDAYLPEGRLSVLGVKIEHSIASFMANKCSNIIALISTEQAIKISSLLNDFSPDNFRFVSKEDLIELDNSISSKSIKGKFVEFEIRHRTFDSTKKFDINHFENYNLISAFLNDYRVIIESKANQYLLTIFPLRSLSE